MEGKTLSQMAAIFLEAKYHVSGDTDVYVDHSLDTIPEVFHGSAIAVCDIMDAFGRECVEAYIESRKAAQLADAATIAALEARVQKLEAALKPFAKWGAEQARWVLELPDATPLCVLTTAMADEETPGTVQTVVLDMTFGDLRRAAALLEKP